MSSPAPLTHRPKITVIMPVYNGSRLLAQTLDSLRNQKFQDFEVLCIDDCSTDTSADILATYAQKDDRFRHLTTAHNLGIVPKLMNFAAPFAQGDRFVYTSQDDLFSTDWLNQMYLRAQETGADAVLPDVEFFFDGCAQNTRIIGYHGNRDKILSGRDAFLASLQWDISGNALWAMSLLKTNGFYDFGMFADEYTVRTYFLKCEKIAFCEGVFFYRQDNPDAITKKVSAKLLDDAHNCYMLWALATAHGFDQHVCGNLAVRALKSVIKAEALVMANPQLHPSIHICDAAFSALKPVAFKESLNHGMADYNRFMRFVYLRAQVSQPWLRLIARIRVRIAAMKRRTK
jgi:glycosyltransferase involved in cell wall biosynthesis